MVQGSDVPNVPYNDNVKITLSKTILEEYIPLAEKVFENDPRGLFLLALIMAQKEGLINLPGTKDDSRSYRTNNPGNIGNVDSGSNNKLATLEDGIKLQRSYILRVAAGQHKAFPLNKVISKKPFYSKEIADNPKRYAGMDPWTYGYRFLYTGELRQFVKLYATGARNGNGYVNMIMSFFKNHGFTVKPDTKLSDIIKLDK